MAYHIYHSSKLMVACWSSVPGQRDKYFGRKHRARRKDLRLLLGKSSDRRIVDRKTRRMPSQNTAVAHAYSINIDILVSLNHDLVWSTSLRVSASYQHLPLSPMALLFPPTAAVHLLCRLNWDFANEMTFAVLMAKPKIRCVATCDVSRVVCASVYLRGPIISSQL